jgi:hypothetical protein
MRPDAQHEIYFSQRFEDALQHGADTAAGVSLALKARVTLVSGASIKHVSRPGNPLTVVVTTALPLPVTILELYVRTGQAGAFEVKVVKGAENAKAYVLTSIQHGARLPP